MDEFVVKEGAQRSSVGVVVIVSRVCVCVCVMLLPILLIGKRTRC